MIRAQFRLGLDEELIVDNFAGGGGASMGIELALGRAVDIAINHDREAVAMHAANHPQSLHLCEDVFDVDPVAVTRGRPVGLGWFSPDCKHFSKAKGGKPRSKKIRGLAWVILRWAVMASPRVILMENVEEFQQWGPLREDGSPCPIFKGRTFRAFVDAMTTGLDPGHPDAAEIVEVLGDGFPMGRLFEGLGYALEWRELRACDYGAPTIRKRLYLVARRDGRPIVWPVASHGAPGSVEVKAKRRKAWRTAAECIDWSIPCPSIFERKRPLAEATMRRIARGIFKFVINHPAPFVVNLANSKTTGRGPNVWSKDEPLRTVTAAAGFGVVEPRVERVAPFVTEHANGSNQRNLPADEPLRTQCAEVKGGHFAKVTAFLAKHYGGNETPGAPVSEPCSTVTTVDHHAVVAATMIRHFGESVGGPCDAPAPTVMADGAGKTGLITAQLIGAGGPARQGEPRPVDVPESTVMVKNDRHLVTSHLSKLYGTSTGQEAQEPLRTVTSGGNHIAEVRAFLIKYYGTAEDGVDAREPMHTVTAKDRVGLVTIHGEEYVITDIGMRMLEPHELYRAQGFPGDYVIASEVMGRNGKMKRLSKSAQVRMCGNAVCPPVAQALVEANCAEMGAWERGERKGAVA